MYHYIIIRSDTTGSVEIKSHDPQCKQMLLPMYTRQLVTVVKNAFSTYLWNVWGNKSVVRQSIYV